MRSFLDPRPPRGFDTFTFGVCALFLTGAISASAQQKYGEVPELRWESKAVAAPGGYMYERSILNKTDKLLFVDWPLTEFHRKWIAPGGPWKTSAGPYSDPSAKESRLEYTLEPKYTQTIVYRGLGEPSDTKVAVASIVATIAVEGRESNIVAVNLQITSRWQPSDSGFSSKIELLNRGDAIRVDWGRKSEIVIDNADEAKLFAKPLELSSSGEPRVLQIHSAERPRPVERSFTIRTRRGESVLEAKALLFLPARER